MTKKKWLVILLDLGTVATAMAAVPLTGWMFDVIPDCPATKLGLLCPSCGGTRCVRYFFSGHFGDAFAVNPFFFFLILYLGSALVLLNVGVLLKRNRIERIAVGMVNWKAVIIAAALFAVFGVTRNFL